MKKTLLAVLGSLFLVAGCGGTEQAIESDDTLDTYSDALSAKALLELYKARTATAKYQDVNAALADGYVAASPCEAGLGIHYLNFNRFMAPPDALHPADLMYYPDASSPTGLTLGGVQYFSVVFQDGAPFVGASPNPTPAPRSTSIQATPKLFAGEGVFTGPIPGRFPGMPWHFFLKAWLFKLNPNGVFTESNPRVDCTP